jgi:uncharacterized protein (UPF0262 family)
MTAPGADSHNQRSRLIEIRLDETSIARSPNPNIDHEREVAIYDLLDDNSFALDGREGGPYRLVLGTQDERLVFNVLDENGQHVVSHMLSFSPLRRVMKDYFIVCENYYAAIKSAPPSRIQSIDMGRRALHSDGGRVLAERLKGKIVVDHDTARRLFTLICSLHWKG